jgi:hypothetical protein
MDAKELSANSSIDQYERLADDLASAYNTGDAEALQRIRDFFRLGRAMTQKWVRKNASRHLRSLRGLPHADRPDATLALSDARDLISDGHGFENWQSLVRFLEEVKTPGSQASEFESAVEMVVTGDANALERALQKNPDLSRARSPRAHGATLLHYVSANGVEDFRQKTPKNAVEIARMLLEAGAEVDADLAYGMSPTSRARYPGRIGSTTLGLVATSIHPAHAGVQIALLDLLLDAGASIDGLPGCWSPINASLANGRPEAAQFLAARGAKLDLEGAAGVGRLDLVEKWFGKTGRLKTGATKTQMKSGFMWACEYGQTRVVEFLIDRGLDVAAKVRGMTGLHWAMVGGHKDTIKLLLERKAPLEVRNSFGGTALGCAIWAVGNSDPIYRWPEKHTDWVVIIQMLIEAGARVYEADGDFPTGNPQVDELLLRHGMKPQ